MIVFEHDEQVFQKVFTFMPVSKGIPIVIVCEVFLDDKLKWWWRKQ